MAIDELLLRAAPQPALRAYRWTEPTVSFGYFGHYQEVAARWPGRALVRRWTGGGEVPHSDDFTYTLVVPAAHPFARSAVRESYRAIHLALAALIPGAALAASDAAAAPACFARPVIADVLLDGRKVAGAAQRRSQHGLLHQGSVQGLPTPEHADLALQFAHRLSHTVTVAPLPDSILTAATALAAEKYQTRTWLHRR